MFKIFLWLSIVCANIYALSLSSNDSYKIIESKNYNIVYTDDFKNEVKFIKYHLDDFIKHNDKSFAYSFDEPLRLVLISNNVQVPNAFSTQFPYNLGVLYNGGGGKNDYFASTSWLTTLLVHEMVHNYQTNAKKSKISKTLHKFLGNNYLPVIGGIVPLFTLPNLLLPTALLEGNSVLNESVYQNGGRLHSGEHNALKNAIIFDGKLDASRFINDHLSFPYTREKYIVGGFYMQYLASKYGLDKVNKLFYENSIHSINPLLLNSTYQTHFGVGFEQSVNDFIAYTKKQYSDFNQVQKSNILKSSKDEIYLSKIDNKIYFITTDLTTTKELNKFDISNGKVVSDTTSFTNAKIFKKDGKLLVSTSALISAGLYKHGLFDEGNYIDDETIGKDVKAISNGKLAYINIKESSLNTKLYIDDKYYSEVASSAIFDKKGNIYYFKQDKNTRVLYKNKKPIFKYKGHFGKLTEVVGNAVYFIANTKSGSSLYKVVNNRIFKLNSAQNIVNSKIIDKNRALVVSVTSSQYNVQILDIQEELVSSIPSYSIVKNKQTFNFTKNYLNEELSPLKYNELGQLQFSSLYPFYSYNSSTGSNFMINAIFTDPVMFNMINVYAFTNDEKNIVGTSYINERYIPFKVNVYNMDRDKSIEYAKERGYGASIEVYGPILKKGRHLLEFNLKHYLDDENEDKNPTVFSLAHQYKKGFLLEDSPYMLSDIELLAKEDRGDMTFGASLEYTKHIYDEFYLNIGGKYIDSDVKILGNNRGISVENDYGDTLNDKTAILMEGYDADFYVKDISKVSIGISKTLHINKYFSKFPFSLRKESIFYEHNQFNLTTYKDFTIKENIYGIKFDILYFHKLPIPTTIKVIKNDLSQNDEKIVFTLGVQF